MFLKIERINKITVQTVYSCCPDPTKTLPKHPYHPIKPNCHHSNEIASWQQETEVAEQTFCRPSAGGNERVLPGKLENAQKYCVHFEVYLHDFRLATQNVNLGTEKMLLCIELLFNLFVFGRWVIKCLFNTIHLWNWTSHNWSLLPI